ncbi:hypothetical protein PTSG_02205 [Salpingoeca rosetta]|uniref:Centromere protein O n=1 Tax=Salpingoeca rosetta (strain ATCC 50818 / BSB-021) TaxID=946362 RepID=F2U1I6_SALR5|nr:uncharacterized protein PTSG_02205 [Salpingoeca rosetta]EGD81488.1 hypothetical protein PTSG_02205 [Salpingoeca rosetta]|eukprot:XP_004996692.1 hypothetical protein PTSG_02205 [Salpingoeca rosetta]
MADANEEALVYAELQQELIELQREKRLLQQKLRRHRLQQSLSKKTATLDPSLQGPAAKEVVDAAATNAKRAKLSELQRAYRLGGCAVFAIDPVTVGVRFETSFEGTYYEEYFAVLVFNEEHFELSKHTLPGFLPLDRLRQHARTNLTTFLEDTSALLQAYVSRRQQLNALQEVVVSGEEVLTNPSCSCAEFLTMIEERLVKVRLTADDLDCAAFTSLTIHSTGMAHCFAFGNRVAV